MKKLINFLKPEWVSKKWRKGSMGEADKKSALRFCAIATVIYFLIYSMLYFGLFNTYMYKIYKATDQEFHLFSWIAAILSIIGIWKLPDATAGEKKGWIFGFFVLFGLALAIVIGGGFDFNLNKIK